MRIIITGATGFVGRNLIANLEGHEVVGIVRSPDTHLPQLASTVVIDLILRDAPLHRLPTTADVVVHLAQPRPASARVGEVAAVNVAATAALLDYAGRAGCRLFLFASTGNVYAPSDEPHDEGDPLDDQAADAYTKAKIDGERLVAARRDLVTVIARLFVPYGPGQRRRMIPDLIQRIRDGRPVTLVDGGKPAVNPIHIRDVCRQLVALLEISSTVRVNIGGTEAYDVGGIARLIGRLGGWDLAFVRDDTSRRSNLIGRIERVVSLTGIRPEIDLVAGIDEMITLSRQKS
jgi:UDP-glucose 4-epimerase